MSDARKLLHFLPGFITGGMVLFSLVVSAAAEFRLEQTVNGTSGGEAFGGSFRVADTGGQSVSGVSKSGQCRIDYGFWPTLGSPPIPETLHRSAQPGQPLILSFATIVEQLTDSDGDAVQVVSVSPVSARGGAVEFGATALTYKPPLGFVGMDECSYLLVDSGGDVASGSVKVIVGATQPEPPHVVAGPIVTNGVFLVRYEGVPGITYTIETCERLESGTWRKLSNVTASGGGGAFGAGIFELRDLADTASNHFFRAVWPAY